VQLFDDHLEFEPADFEYLRFIPLKILQQWTKIGEAISFDNYAKLAAVRCTETVNRRLSMSVIGTKSKNSILQCLRVFGYLWLQGTPQRKIGFHEYIELKKIRRDLKYCRNCGRPKKENKSGIKYHYENDMTRALKRLERVGLIESDRKVIDPELKPDKKKKNTFYRVSNVATSNVFTHEEENQKLWQLFLQTYLKSMNTQNRLQAAIWFMKKKGINCSSEEIDKWVEDWRAEAFKGGHAIKPEMMGVIPNF